MDPLGALLGSLLAPKMVETSLGIFLGRSWAGPYTSFLDETCLDFAFGPAKGRSIYFFFGPRGLQERSKRPPRGKRSPEQIFEPPK